MDWAALDRQAWGFVRDMAYFWAQNLQIIDRNNNLVPLVANNQQLELLYHIGLRLAAGKPVRIRVLKARRLGISTAVTALGISLTRLYPNYRAFACAHDQDGTQTMWDMAKLFLQYMPDHVKLPMDRSNTKELAWSAPHHSSYRFKTAGGESGRRGVGRSKEITFLHISEKAFIDNWAEIAKGIAACVPDTNPRSMVIEESTANGAQGAWYDGWNDAVKAQANRWAGKDRAPFDLDGWLPLFFSWLDFPDYAKDVPVGYEWGDFDEFEVGLKKLGATPEQLYFRRIRVAEHFDGDPESFAQEMPATPEEAFRASGRPAIPSSIITYHDSLVCEPVRKVVLSRGPNGELVVRDRDGQAFYWRIWNEPQEHTDYTVFGDVAENQPCDPNDEHSDQDESAGAVLNRKKFQYDAEAVGLIDADEWGEQLRMCAEWYNHAYASPEANAVGMAALTAFKGYERTYQRKAPVESMDGDLKAFWGWKTTTQNRDYLIDTWLANCRPHPNGGFDGQVKVFSSILVDQERSFVKKKSGKREHSPRSHDDLLFAHMGCLQLHFDCPRTYTIPYTVPKRRVPKGTPPPYAYVGGRDPGVG